MGRRHAAIYRLFKERPEREPPPVFVAIHRLAGRRFPSKSAEGRDLSLSRPEGQIAIVVRGGAASDGRRTGRRGGIHGPGTNSGHPAEFIASKSSVDYRQQGRR